MTMRKSNVNRCPGKGFSGTCCPVYSRLLSRKFTQAHKGKRPFRLAERDAQDVVGGIGAVGSRMRHFVLPVSAAAEAGHAQQDTDVQNAFCLVHIWHKQCVCKSKGICSGQDTFFNIGPTIWMTWHADSLYKSREKKRKSREKTLCWWGEKSIFVKKWRKYAD